MNIALLILHGLVAVALLGALTHQALTASRGAAPRGSSFVDRYLSVRQRSFTGAVVVLYVLAFSLGALIYPAYRLDVRVPFEEMSLGWAVGLFELKEHFGGIGLAALPFYASTWREQNAESHRRDRIAITWLLALIVWWDFVVGHVLNNIRGLG